MKKKILSLLMSLVMIAGLAVVPAGTADAASKRGAVVPMSFWDSIRWDDEYDWEDNWNANRLWVSVWGKENVSLSSKTTLSFTLYLSKYMFDKDAGEDGHHQLGLSIGMDISDENWEWMGKMRSTDDLMIVKYN